MPQQSINVCDAFRRSQSVDELCRKADKAERRRGKIWTVEEIDLAWAEAEELRRSLFGGLGWPE